MSATAVTKIWPIKDSLRRVVDYAKNPAKTEYSDLQSVLHYAANGEKTEHGAERSLFVTGVNCSRDSAFAEMLAVQERFGKTGGNVAYHAYQSFKPGEVTPELCHQMGVELDKRMWGEDHQHHVQHLRAPGLQLEGPLRQHHGRRAQIAGAESHEELGVSANKNAGPFRPALHKERV